MHYCYLNGRILPENEARVSILDIGLLRGYGIYEAMALIHGKIFRWEDHAARFRKSADFLHITVPLSDAEIENVVLELVEKNIPDRKPAPRMNVKFILTGGTAIGGIEFDPAFPTFYIFLEEWKPFDPNYYSGGAKVITYEHLRQNPEYKTTNYITTALLQKPMRDAGALEIVYTWQNKVLECATSNLFIVKDGTLVTAKDDILKGVTRNVTIELAKTHGIPVEERQYSTEEMLSADECFLTSSFKDIVPVTAVDDKHISTGRPGEVTQKVTRLFKDYLAAY